MRALLTATFRGMALIGRADAGFQAAPEIGNNVSLVCYPPLDRTGRNPVVKTYVELSLKSGHEVQEFTVIHELFDGRKGIVQINTPERSGICLAKMSGLGVAARSAIRILRLRHVYFVRPVMIGGTRKT
jgi:hypothetical protein